MVGGILSEKKTVFLKPGTWERVMEALGPAGRGRGGDVRDKKTVCRSYGIWEFEVGVLGTASRGVGVGT